MAFFLPLPTPHFSVRIFPPSLSLSPSSSLRELFFFFIVHGLNLCLIADYWDFARMRGRRGDPRLSLVRLSSPGSAHEARRLPTRTSLLILSLVSRSLRLFFRIGESTDYSRLCGTSKCENGEYIKRPLERSER